METKIEKLVIIGSGPAGLTAGIYAARATLSPLIIDGSEPGGQLMGTTYIENWPGNKSILGPTLIQNMRDQAKQFSSRFLAETVTNIDITKKPFEITTNKESSIKAHAIIIATGASPKKLNCPGEKEYWGKGITTCAICDGALYRDKKVIVLGGGDTAMESASFLAKFTNDITIIHIGDKLTASVPMQKRVLDNKDIKIIYNSTITEFRGDSNHLTDIDIINLKTQEKTAIKIDGAFIAIGQQPNTAFLPEKIDLTDYGYIIIRRGHQGYTKTSVDGIFAAGDVTDPYYRQAITSAGTGCMAALDAENYLIQIL